MCYAKPGPRCVGHTRPLRDQAEATMVAARLAYEENPTPENEASLEKSAAAFATAEQNYREAWFVSPERIRDLRDEAVVAAQNNDFEYLAALTKQADEIEQWREQQIARSKEATVERQRVTAESSSAPESVAHTAIRTDHDVEWDRRQLQMDVMWDYLRGLSESGIRDHFGFGVDGVVHSSSFFVTRNTSASIDAEGWIDSEVDDGSIRTDRFHASYDGTEDLTEDELNLYATAEHKERLSVLNAELVSIRTQTAA